ncbi:DUF6098 family protein [Streptomyces sp. NPDC006267]
MAGLRPLRLRAVARHSGPGLWHPCGIGRFPWGARRLYDYSHLPRVRGSGARPWVLHGTEAGRGPDNEPLVRQIEPLGWIAPPVIAQANDVIGHQPGAWGPMLRYDTA